MICEVEHECHATSQLSIQLNKSALSILITGTPNNNYIHIGSPFCSERPFNQAKVMGFAWSALFGVQYHTSFDPRWK